MKIKKILGYTLVASPLIALLWVAIFVRGFGEAIAYIGLGVTTGVVIVVLMAVGGSLIDE